MEMNGVNFTWITGAGSGSNVNAYSIALHEGGHYYGLGHSDDRGATMYFAYTGGIDAIGDDDSDGICSLYPGSGTADCTMTGCPSGQECVSGTCRRMMGDGSLCSPCSDSSQCGGAGNFCIMYPTGGAFCGRACSSSADCGTGYQCFNVSGSGQCIGVVGGSPSCAGATPTGCRSDSECSATQRCNTSTGRCEARPTGGAELGQPCANDDACNSGLCATTPAGSVCSQSCDGFNTGSCPAGFYCDGEAAGVCGTGLCLAGSAGGAPLGASCATDTDCATLMCDGSVCATPCRPDAGVSTCAMGFVCRPGAAPGCGACRSEADLGQPGDACGTNDDCASGLCAVNGDETFCTDYCGEADPCPPSFTCTPLGDTAICVPPAGGGGRSEGGCGCAAPGLGSGHPAAPAVLVLAGLAFLARRRRDR
jgi:hypothetical protein